VARRKDTDLLDALQFTIRQFGLFHAKIGGCRMIINQHWGIPNSKWPGSLWKENLIAG
jgi:hypothetical protein